MFAGGYDTLQGVVDKLWPRIADAACGPSEETEAESTTATADAAASTVSRCVNFMFACNFQCLLLTGWARHNTALRRLRAARAAFAVAVRCAGESGGGDAPPYPWRPEGTAARTPLASAVQCVHALFTHTLFYYAQVYGSLGYSAKSAKYVELTLSRQLLLSAAVARDGGDGGADEPGSDNAGVDMSVHEYEVVTPLDPTEWCKNALRLADYFLSAQLFQKTLYCLTAADVMLSRVPAPAPGGPLSWLRVLACNSCVSSQDRVCTGSFFRSR